MFPNDGSYGYGFGISFSLIYCDALEWFIETISFFEALFAYGLLNEDDLTLLC